MYQPAHFAQTDTPQLVDLIAKHPLGAWVTLQNGALSADHIPFLLDITRGEHGVLMGHVARANPIWQRADQQESLVIFQGPQAYISPNYYPTKHEHGKAVPTWNYAVVHAYGTPQVMDDAAWLAQFLAQLTATHEAHQAKPWAMSDAPPDYIAAMMRAVVGIEIPLRRVVGKWKTSQNQPAVNQAGVAQALAGVNDPMAELVLNNT